MKDILKVLAMVVSLSFIFFFSAEVLFTQEKQEIKPPKLPTSQDTTTQETYVSKVIISVPWAKKNIVYDGEESPPGEFGVYQFVVPESLKDQEDAGLPEGPTSFTIAPYGDIYITDPLNYRIQRFSPEGHFVFAIPDIRIEVYKWNTICADPDSNTYLLCREYNDKQFVYKYDQLGKLLATYPFLEERGHVDWTKLYCDKKSVQNDSYVNAIKMLPSKISGSFLGVDEKGRIYTQSFTYDKGYNVTSFIQKFDAQGNLLARIQWKTSFGSSWASDYWRGAREIVDAKGNIYIYYSTKEGITITKWYKPE